MDRAVSPSYVLFGFILMLLGLLMLADRLDWAGIHWNVPIWPYLLLTLGGAKLSDRRVDARGRLRLNRGGGWLMFIGAWGLLTEYRLFGVDYRNSWPLLVIGLGALVVWQAVDPLTCDTPAHRESRS